MANYIVPVLSDYEWQKGVLALLNTPPGSPSNGDRYIVGSSPTGVWVGHANQIVTYDNNVWTYLIPWNGLMVYVQNMNRLIQFTTVWEGLVASGKDPVTAVSVGLTLTKFQFGETVTCDAATAQTFFLPSVDASDVGAWYRFVKLGAGDMTIEAADSDKIADSGAGDTIYNDEPIQTYATLTLLLVSATQWTITEGHGTWTTTD